MCYHCIWGSSGSWRVFAETIYGLGERLGGKVQLLGSEFVGILTKEGYKSKRFWVGIKPYSVLN